MNIETFDILILWNKSKYSPLSVCAFVSIFSFLFYVSINFFQIWKCVHTRVRGVRNNHHHHNTWVVSGLVFTTSHYLQFRWLKSYFRHSTLDGCPFKNIMFQRGSPSPSASTLMNNSTSLTETTRRPAGCWATSAPNLNTTSSTASKIHSEAANNPLVFTIMEMIY